MKKIFTFGCVLCAFNLFGQTHIQLTQYKQTVPKGKVWIISNLKEYTLSLSDGINTSGTMCYAAFHSNPSYLFGITYEEPEVGRTKTIGFTFSESLTLDESTYQIKPYFFIDENMGISNGIQKSLQQKFEKKEMKFFEGTSVWLTSCVKKINIEQRAVKDEEESSYNATVSTVSSVSQKTQATTIASSKLDVLTEAYSFNDGVALVACMVKGKYKSEEKRYGYINDQGRFIANPSFISAKDFSDGYAVVSLNNIDYFFIDKNGKDVFNSNFEQIKSFSEGLAAVKVSGQGWGFIDSNGLMVIKPQYQDAGIFHNGLAMIKLNEKWGFVNASGKEVIYPQFTEVRDFHEGLALVRQQINYNLVEYKYVDTLGNIAFKLSEKDKPLISYEGNKSTSFCDFHDGSTIIRADRTKGYVGYSGPAIINKKGEIKIKMNGAIEIYPESEGLYLINYYGKYGFLNSKGKWEITNAYQEAGSFQEGYARVSLNKNWGFIDKTGKIVINQDINKTKSDVIKNAPFQSVSDFKDGIAAVQTRGKIGFIDKSGNWVIEPIYEDVKLFKNGIAAVKSPNNSGWNYIDKSGKTLFENFK